MAHATWILNIKNYGSRICNTKVTQVKQWKRLVVVIDDVGAAVAATSTTLLLLMMTHPTSSRLS